MKKNYVGIICIYSLFFLFTGTLTHAESSEVQRIQVNMSDPSMWEVEGVAQVDGSTITLTTDDEWKWGRVWSKTNLKPPFIVDFKYQAGGGSGADGFTFFFLADKLNSSSLDGEGLGFEGTNGYAIEFDNYLNNSDPNEHHVALIQNNVDNHLAHYSTPKTEDNQIHNVRVSVAHTSVVVLLDGESILRYDDLEPRATYGIGFSGSTGTFTNEHKIMDVSFSGLKATLPPSDLEKEYTKGIEKNKEEYNSFCEKIVLQLKEKEDKGVADQTLETTVNTLCNYKSKILKENTNSSDNAATQNLYDSAWLIGIGEGVFSSFQEMRDSGNTPNSIKKFFDVRMATGEFVLQEVAKNSIKPVFLDIYQDEEVANQLASDYSQIISFNPYVSVTMYGAFQQNLMEASFNQVEKVLDEIGLNRSSAISHSSTSRDRIEELNKRASNHVHYILTGDAESAVQNSKETNELIKDYNEQIDSSNKNTSDEEAPVATFFKNWMKNTFGWDIDKNKNTYEEEPVDPKSLKEQLDELVDTYLRKLFRL